MISPKFLLLPSDVFGFAPPKCWARNICGPEIEAAETNVAKHVENR